MADKGKFAVWGRVGSDDGNVVVAGRNAYLDAYNPGGVADDRLAEWRDSTPAGTNRGTIRKGRAAWAKARTTYP